jgi:hypothetical protein
MLRGTPLSKPSGPAKRQDWFQRVRQKFHSALHLKILNAACVSVVRGQELRLPRHFVCEASEARFELLLSRPLLCWGRAPAVRVELFVGDGQRLPGEPDCVRAADTDNRRTACLALKINLAEIAGQHPIKAVVLRRSNRQILGTFRLYGLPEAKLAFASRARVRQQLRVERHGFWIEARDLCYRSDQLPDGSDALAVELTLRSTGFNACHREWATFLRLSMALDGCIQALSEIPLVLTENPALRQVLVVRIRGSPLAACESGLCRLIVSVDGRELAVLFLQKVSEPQLLLGIELRSVTVDAIGPDGARTGQVRTVRRNRYQYLQPVAVIAIDILAPNSTFSGSVDWSLAGQLLQQDAFMVTLDQRTKRLLLPRLQLTTLTISEPTELRLTVGVASNLAQTVQILLLPEERIADFEGRLNVDPDQLLADDGEYDDILRRLGVKARNPADQGFG